MNKRITRIPVPHTDYRTHVKALIFSEWQSRWDYAYYNKLHVVHPTLGKWKGSSRANRKDESVLARIRIGHTYLSHGYLLRGEESVLGARGR